MMFVITSLLMRIKVSKQFSIGKLYFVVPKDSDFVFIHTQPPWLFSHMDVRRDNDFQ